MLNERRRTVLSALVNEYVASVQPVGSKVLVERYHLGCSPATVRSELAALEETGMLFQPHVSAGRIPTDTGYRAFVDGVVETGVPELDSSEADGVWRHYAQADHELGEVLRDTSALLSRLTSYVAVVAAPTITRARIRRVTLVPLAARRALVVVVTDSGQVANRTIEFESDVSADDLLRVETYLSQVLDGALGDEARTLRRTIDPSFDDRAGVARTVLDEVIDCLAEADEARVLTGGVSALLAHPEFNDPGAVRPVVGLLEDSLEMLRVLTDVMRSSEIAVRIGHENAVGALEHASFVAARYGDGETGGIVGVIGPTRMDYRRAISAVRTVSAALSDVLEV
jgi:heat-inducible transcriptional repressor